MSDDAESGKWLKVKSQMPRNEKVCGLSDAAFRLHISTSCWCCDEVNDGKFKAHVPAAMPRAPLGKKLTDAIRELVRSGLWLPTEDGYQINDFLKYNMSRARWEALKAAGREGGKRSGQSRVRKNEAQPEAPASAAASATVQPKHEAPPEHDNDNDKRDREPLPKDLTGSAGKTGDPIVFVEDDSRVSCPADLEMLAGQRMQIAQGTGANDYQLDQLTQRFRANFSADPSDKRLLPVWRKCLAQWASGKFSNPRTRPPRSPDEETGDQQRRRLKDGPRQPNVLDHSTDEAHLHAIGGTQE